MGLAVTLAAAGSGYQVLAERAELAHERPAGRFVEVGGRKVRVLCAGAAGPSVVIEAGSGDNAASWEGMVRRVAAFARVCAYDRAGLGLSDAAPGPRTMDERAAELHAVLGAAGLPAPYVLVGHSYGGFIVRRFVVAYPAEVHGVILVDAPEEDYALVPDGMAVIRAIGWRARVLGWMTRLGVARLLWAGEAPLRTSQHFEVADEMDSYDQVAPGQRVAGGLGGLGDTPLVVISRAVRDPVSGAEIAPDWQEGQRRLLRLSTRSRQVIAERSGHVMQFSEPEVIEGAIRALVE